MRRLTGERPAEPRAGDGAGGSAAVVVRLDGGAVVEVPSSAVEAAATCSVCSEPLAFGVVELPCRHRFHAKCIYTWARRSATCPVCRAGFGPRDLAEHEATPLKPEMVGWPYLLALLAVGVLLAPHRWRRGLGAALHRWLAL